MIKWFKFDSRQAFDLWHEALKSRLGYPLPSKDLEGNIIGEPFTTEYTSCIEFAPNDFRAQIAEEYAQGLTPSTQPIFPDERYSQS